MPLVELTMRVGRRMLRQAGIRNRYVNTAQGRLHFYEAPGTGSGLPTVVIHGFGSSALPFGPILQQLRGVSRHVWAPDLPGHGFSATPRTVDANVLLDALIEGLEKLLDGPAVVFGNSLGGATAVMLAERRPHMVAGLALGSPGGADMEEAALQDLLKVFDVHTAKDARALLDRLFHDMPWYAPAMAPLLVQLLKRPSVRTLRAAITRDNLLKPQQLASLTMPVLLLWGRSERLLPPEHLAWFKTHLPPHAVVEEPEQFGHSPQLDRPALLAARLCRFVEDVSNHRVETARPSVTAAP